MSSGGSTGAQRPDARAEWLGSWRVALRLARRDALRHKGRSALIVVMVAFPVLLLVGANTLFSTQDLTRTEQLPYALGQTQARIQLTGVRITPNPYLSSPGYGMSSSCDEKDCDPTPIPGWGSSPASQLAAIEDLFDAKAIRIDSRHLTAAIGRRIVNAQALGVDAAAHAGALAGVTYLDSGRWAARSDEVVVTPAGISRGLPDSGTFQVREAQADGTETTRTLTVVGVGRGWETRFQATPVDLIGYPSATGPQDGSGENPAYLIDRPTPVTWAEVQRVSPYGIEVLSREVVLNPPPREQVELSEAEQQFYNTTQFGQLMTTAIGAIGLLLETTLLVGPAFAVSAARSRRTMALAASNGATVSQLRRTVLAQALVLGAVSALIGGLLGVLGSYAVLQWSQTRWPEVFFGPFDLPVAPVALILGCAILAAVIAALVPARGLGRLDIVGVMRGQSVSPPARLRTPVAGLVITGIGTTLVFWSIARTQQMLAENLYTAWALVTPLMAMLGAVLLVVGVLLLVPTVLVLLGRAATPAPVALRMAMRDAARQRGRATSTVAAILGGAALLSAIAVLAASGAAYGAKTYQPRLPEGQGMVNPMGGPSGSVTAADPSIQSLVSAVRSVDPALTVATVSMVDTSPKTRTPSDTPPFLIALRPGCTAQQTLEATEKMPSSTAEGQAAYACLSLSGDFFIASRSGIVVGDVEDLTAQYQLTATQSDTLRRGGTVVVTDPTGPPPPMVCEQSPEGVQGCFVNGNLVARTEIVDRQVEFARGTRIFDEAGMRITIDKTFRLPAVPATNAGQLNASGSGTGMYGQPDGVGALISRETAAAHSLPHYVDRLSVVDPRGPISSDTEAKLRDVVDANGLGYTYVERGYIAYDTIVVIVFASIVGLIILVATLVSTALSTAETQSMMGTFAAVGATRRTRRNLAAAQAGSLGIVGALLGVLVGLVPGIALARATTMIPTEPFRPGGPLTFTDPTVVVPWLQLAIPVIGVPLVAAALAWVAIRRAPVVTRRLT